MAAKFTDVDFVKIDVDEISVIFASTFLSSFLNWLQFRFRECFFWFFKILILILCYCEKDVAQEYGVQAMPTFVLLKKGKEIDRVVGAKKDELQKKVEKYRATQS